MRPTKLLLQIKPAFPKHTPRGGFSRSRDSDSDGINFDRNFPSGRLSKAWDGQDRDEFFKKKYAHVHARDLRKTERYQRNEWQNRESKNRDFEKKGFRDTKFNKFDKFNRDEKTDKFVRHDRHDSKKEGRRSSTMPQVSFNEYLYGTSSVLAALKGNKRVGFGMLYTSKSPNSADLKIIQAANERNLPIEYDTPRGKLDQLTSNAVHNGYAIRVRPLVLTQVQHLLFNSVGIEEVSKSDEAVEKIRKEVESEANENTNEEPQTNTETQESTPSYGMVEYKFEQPVIVPQTLVSPSIKSNAVGVYIDEVTDPHNIGAILRSAQFLGADFAVVSALNCARLSPAVSKVSAGALESFPVYACDSPLKFFEKSKAEGWNLVAAVAPGTDAPGKHVKPSELEVVNSGGPSLLVVGSEGTGLRKSLLQRCTHVVSIANSGPVAGSESLDSLNVSVATALLLSRFFTD